jgi:hypothetical protein
VKVWKQNAVIDLIERNLAMLIKYSIKRENYVILQKYLTLLKKVSLLLYISNIAFPYLWVNGEKYVFSKEVIDAGRNLFNNFCKILYHVKDAY